MKEKNDTKDKFEPISYQHLAPVDNLIDKTTFDALDYALKNDKVHNIALTGSYGAGKSSILASYVRWRSIKNPVKRFFAGKFNFFANVFKNYEQNKFLNVSLATFALENNGELPEDKTQEIEKSILQQFFYKKPGNKFPYSRFNRIKTLSLIKVFVIELIIATLSSFCIKYLKNDLWIKIRDSLKISFSFETKHFSFGISFFSFVLTVSVIISLFLIIKYLLKDLNTIHLSKINIKEVQFGLGDIDDESLLNRYIDEVLYFFETTKYKFVVFEDLDRFQNTEIFIKLRELNTIINNYENIKQKVVFIYALRDEVFSDSNRTKFFEFIIPVIPVINSQNSNDIFLQKQKESPNSALSEIDEHFLNDIGLYIDDMRLLTNTINEFRIYDEKINKQFYETTSTEPHDRNKIFALILYKNLYPKDFSNLSKNEGFLYSVIKSKEDYILKQQKEFDTEISKFIETRKELEKFDGYPIKQLRLSYLMAILNTSNYYIHHKNIDTYLSDESFNKMIEENRLSIQTSQGTINLNFNWDAIQNTVNPQYTYSQNEIYINNINNGQIEAINAEIKSLKEKKENLLHCSLSELNNLRSLIDEKAGEYLEKQRETHNVGTNDLELRINTDLVYYLLNNGFIDEDYFDYISYFYPGSLSPSDKQFLLLIQSNKEPIYNRKLDKIENLISRIRSNEWTRDAILNNDLLNYLLENKKNVLLNDFVSVMYVHDSDNIESGFYSQFTCNNQNLYKQLDFCVNKYIEADNYHYDKIFNSFNYDILFRFFKNTEIINNTFKLFVYDNIKFLCRVLSDDEIKIIENRLIKLNQKLTLCNEMKTYPIYDLILKNKLYEINLNNLLFILNLENENSDDLITKLNKCDDYIKDYFYQNKKLFVEKVLLANEEKLHETNENMKDLINDDSISFETRMIVIEKNRFMVNDINTFPKVINVNSESATNTINLWEILLSNNKVLSVWNNVLVYYEEYGIDESLIEFINNNIIEISKSEHLKKEELDNRENERRKSFVNLFSALLECDSLSNAAFEIVAEKCPFIYKEIDISPLNEIKVKELCENNKLSYNQNHINLIRSKNPKLLNNFINKNIKAALKEENIGFITVSDVQNYLCSSEISNDCFISFIENGNFSWEEIYNEEVSKKVINFIIEKTYKKRLPVQLTFLIEKMIAFEYKINQIIKIVNLQMDNNQIEEIKCCLELLNPPYKNLFIRERKQLEMQDTDFNEELCKNLKNKKLISSYSKDAKGNIKINRKLK